MTALPANLPLYELNNQLAQVEAEASNVANAYRTSRDLTPEGRRNAWDHDHRRPRWASQVQDIAARMVGALDAAEDRRDAARAEVARPKLTTEEAILAELRYARRSDAIRATIDGNPDVARRLVADAEPADLAILLDVLDASDSDIAAKAAEMGLRDRAPEYAAAAEAVAKLPEARSWLAARVSAASEVVANFGARTDAGGPLATVDVHALGDLANLEG